MKEINTQVTTYDPEIVYWDAQQLGEPMAIMSPVEDGTGDFVHIYDYNDMVSAFQQRITYLENCNHDLLGELTGDW